MISVRLAATEIEGLTFTLSRSTGWKKVSHMLSFLFKISWQTPVHCSSQAGGVESEPAEVGVASIEWMAVFIELMALMDGTCCSNFPTPLTMSEAHLHI